MHDKLICIIAFLASAKLINVNINATEGQEWSRVLVGVDRISQNSFGSRIKRNTHTHIYCTVSSVILIQDWLEDVEFLQLLHEEKFL